MGGTRINNKIACIAAAIAAAMFVSCKNDLAKVDAQMAAKTQPATVIDTFALVRVDSGKVVMRMHAAQVVMEPNPKDASLTDRKASGGVEIEMYDPATGAMSARLTSHRAIEHASSGLSEALGDVLVVNQQGDSIQTERLVWDRRKHIFYTDLFARIVREGDVMRPSRGFEADENFRWYNLFNSQGDINIEDSLSRMDPVETN